MLEKVKENWQQLKEAEPGHRFQDRYEQRQRECQGKFDLGKIINVVLGLLVTALGIFMVPAPGPGTIIMFVGLGLIGSEFLPVARCLDGAEVRIRPIVHKVKETWERISLPVKALMGMALLAGAALVAYSAFQFFFDGSPQLLMEFVLPPWWKA